LEIGVEDDYHGRQLAVENELAARPSSSCPTSIEFFGLPGSGKTTLAREVMSILDRTGRPFSYSGNIMGDDLPLRQRSLHRLRLIVRDYPRQLRLVTHAARHIVAGPSHAKDELKTIWNYCSVLAMITRHSRCGRHLLVLDQGIVQAIWTGRMHSGGDAWQVDAAALIAGEWFSQCLFVHVRAAKDLARSRLQARGGKTSRLQRPDSIGRQALWDKAEGTALQLAGEIESALRGRSRQSRFLDVRNDGRDSPQEIAVRIVHSLQSAEADPL
jgi:AAA domain